MNTIDNNIYNTKFFYHLTNLKARIDAWPNTSMKREVQTKLAYVEQLAQMTEDDYMHTLRVLKKMKLAPLEFDLCDYCLKGMMTYSQHKFYLNERSL